MVHSKLNFPGAEVEMLQNIDVSIPFHCGYIHAIEFSAYSSTFAVLV